MKEDFRKITEKLYLQLGEKSGTYFIKNLNDNSIKIGSSNNVKKRFNDIKNTYNFLNLDSNILFLGYVEVDEYYKLESDLHKIFFNKRLKGEWFDLDFKEIINELESINLNIYVLDKETYDNANRVTYLKTDSLKLRISGEIEFYRCIVRDYATFNITESINEMLIKNKLKGIDFSWYIEKYHESFRDDIIEEKSEIYISDVFSTGIFKQVYGKILNNNMIESITDEIFCIFEEK